MNLPAVFITGAAAGIGRATALTFARAGYLVGAYDVDEAGLATLPAETPSGRMVTGVLNVTDPSAWQAQLADFTEQAGGRLDVLINNAGVLAAGEFASIGLETHRRIVDINLLGTINGCHVAYPYLKATQGAQVVNLCSASAIYGQPELASYGATKSAVRGLTEALDLEWRRDGIRVLAIWPLFVRTGMLDGVSTGSTGSLGVNLTPEDVAESIVQSIQKRPRVLPPKVHYPVGRQAKVLFTTAKFAPAWTLREVNRRIARR